MSKYNHLSSIEEKIREDVRQVLQSHINKTATSSTVDSIKLQLNQLINRYMSFKSVSERPEFDVHKDEKNPNNMIVTALNEEAEKLIRHLWETNNG